ncbi:MAG: DUF4175 family protein, partial [Longimicrobiales bacterium]
MNVTPTEPHHAHLLPDLLREVRRRFLTLSISQALGRAALIAGLLVLGLLWADLLLNLPASGRRVLRWSPLLLVAMPIISWLRTRAKATEERLTLLIDEAAGTDGVAATLLHPNTTGPIADEFRERAAASLAGIRASSVIQRRVGVQPWPLAALAVGAVAVTIAAAGGSEYLDGHWLSPAPNPAEAGAPALFSEREETEAPTLGSIEAAVEPPRYAGLPRRTVGTDELLVALPGSRVRLLGRGTARGPSLSISVVGGGRLTPSAAPSGWSATWTLEPDHRGVEIAAVQSDRIVEQRVLPLRVLRDRAPTVTLSAPAEDIVMAAPVGQLTLTATASDDFGVEAMSLDWVRSRGSGESFDFDQGTWPWDRLDPAGVERSGTHRVDLEGLGLEPGDVLHVRVTAVDANDVTGPGVGVSATRQIRIARDSELTEVTTLLGFPIERDREPVLSQRMIILLTEELIDSTAVLGQQGLREGAADLADEQARLRARVGEQIFSRATTGTQDPEAHLDFEEGEAEVFLDELEDLAEQGPVIDPVSGIATIANVEILAHDHDSDPIIAINRSLLTVYNYMWDAERELREARPSPSLVPQNLALDELQRVRDSERVFARGRVTVAPIDVPGTRGTGDVDDASPTWRRSGPADSASGSTAIAGIEELLRSLQPIEGRQVAIQVSNLAVDLLEAGTDPAVVLVLTNAAAHAEAGSDREARAGLAAALRTLRAATGRVGRPTRQAPTSPADAAYSVLRDSVQADSSPTEPNGARAARRADDRVPFTFATVRYRSGDWDSAPLVPNNLIHALAQYTDLPVAPEGVVVDLASEDVLDYPFLYLTGHLPVFFDEEESRNVVEFVERGGFIFIDDHNHDIDGAFHRS